MALVLNGVKGHCDSCGQRRQMTSNVHIRICDPFKCHTVVRSHQVKLNRRPILCENKLRIRKNIRNNMTTRVDRAEQIQRLPSAVQVGQPTLCRVYILPFNSHLHASFPSLKMCLHLSKHFEHVNKSQLDPENS